MLPDSSAPLLLCDSATIQLLPEPLLAVEPNASKMLIGMENFWLLLTAMVCRPKMVAPRVGQEGCKVLPAAEQQANRTGIAGALGR